MEFDDNESSDDGDDKDDEFKMMMTMITAITIIMMTLTIRIANDHYKASYKNHIHKL